MDTPLVSISCTAYNHERYIEDALEGFINQKTNFTFEVLVHDDASTDRTRDIIKKFEDKYPDLIKPIYQEINQYSKGLSPSVEFQFPRAKGKYIAICEGDDYWIDPHKLQKQIDYMEKHPKCMFCFTNGKIKDESGKQTERIFVPYSDENKKYLNLEDGEYNVGELALLGFIPTASFVVRKSYLDNLPEYYNINFPGEDMKIKLTATAMGYAYFLKDITCVYRENVPESAMSRWANYDQKEKEKLDESFIELLESVDEYTKREYTDKLSLTKVPFLINLALLTKNKNLLKKTLSAKQLDNMSFIFKLFIYLKLYIPVPDKFKRGRSKTKSMLNKVFRYS